MRRPARAGSRSGRRPPSAGRRPCRSRSPSASPTLPSIASETSSECSSESPNGSKSSAPEVSSLTAVSLGTPVTSAPPVLPRCARSITNTMPAGHEQDAEQHREHPAARVPEPPQRAELRGVLRKRAQHRRGLAARLAGARGLDHERLLERRGPSPSRSRSGSRSPSRTRVSTTEASAAEISGRRIRMSGSGSFTCFIATATCVSALNGTSPGEHLEEADPERVHVRLRGRVLAERLLGRDVVGRAEHPPGGGQPLRLQRARDAEVGDLRAALRVDQHVLRLDVTVDEPVRRARTRARGRSRSRRRPPRRPGAGPTRRIRSLSVSPSTYSKTM